jgi:hypothetical protein
LSLSTDDAAHPVGPLTFEVGVAIHGPLDGTSTDGGPAVPGYDEASGERRGAGRHISGRRPVVVEKGEEAVRVATEAIAGQIATAAGRIAASIEQHPIASPPPGHFGLDEVEVTFGITLTGGVQALFTAQTESSAQVTLRMSRRPAQTTP